MEQEERDNLIRCILEIAGIFCELPEALPDFEDGVEVDSKRLERVRVALQERLERFELEVLPRAGQSSCYNYYGEGPVALFFDWTSTFPVFKVMVRLCDGIRPDVPLNQAQQTYIKLLRQCELKGLDVELVDCLVTYQDS